MNGWMDGWAVAVRDVGICVYDRRDMIVVGVVQLVVVKAAV